MASMGGRNWRECERVNSQGGKTYTSPSWNPSELEWDKMSFREQALASSAPPPIAKHWESVVFYCGGQYETVLVAQPPPWTNHAIFQKKWCFPPLDNVSLVHVERVWEKITLFRSQCSTTTRCIPTITSLGQDISNQHSGFLASM